MANILSQEEVDALLRGVSSGKIETEKTEEADKSGVRQYDLASHERVIRGRMPTLEIVNERFSRIFRVTLSSALRKVIDVNVKGIEMMKFGEFLKTVPVPTSINICRMDPLRGFVILVVDARLVFSLVDNFFGGFGQTHMKVEGRDFTAIEQRIIKKTLTMILDDLDRAWKPVHDVKMVHTRSEINPQFATIVVPTEVVIVVTYELELENSLGTFSLMIPYSTVEPIKDKLYAGFQSDQLDVDTRWMQLLRRRLVDVPVAIRARLGGARLTVREVTELRVGDVITLDREVGMPMEVDVQGVTKWRAHPGIVRGNYALKISEFEAKGADDGE